jgi:hypothetical protein
MLASISPRLSHFHHSKNAKCTSFKVLQLHEVLQNNFFYISVITLDIVFSVTNYFYLSCTIPIINRPCSAPTRNVNLTVFVIPFLRHYMSTQCLQLLSLIEWISSISQSSMTTTHCRNVRMQNI